MICIANKHALDKMSLEEYRIWADAHLLWYWDKLIDQYDTGPKQKHYARALILNQPFTGKYEIDRSYGDLDEIRR